MVYFSRIAQIYKVFIIPDRKLRAADIFAIHYPLLVGYIIVFE